MKGDDFQKTVFIAIPLVFLALFYFYPLARIFGFSFMPQGTWDFEKPGTLIFTGYYLRTLWFTFWQATVSTLLTLVAAIPCAYVFARFRFPARGLLLSFTTVPFVLPTVVVASAFQSLLGPNGLVNSWFGSGAPMIQIDQTIWIILLAHVFYNFTVIFRMTVSYWTSLDEKLNEAAQVLGASPWRTFLKIELPLLRPAILTSSLLVFIFCFASFGVILILGGPRFSTIETEIYRQAMNYLNLPMAAALSIIQILFTFILMWVYARMQRKVSLEIDPGLTEDNLRRAVGFKRRMMVCSAGGFIVLFLLSPMAALIIQSLTCPDGWSFHFYWALFEDKSVSYFYIPPIKAILYSLGFALAAMLIALFIALPAATYLSGRKNRLSGILDPLFMLPLSTSAVTLGLGFVLALSRPPLNLMASICIIPIAHALVGFPFVLRSILPAFQSIPGNLREAAALLGAAPFKVWLSVDFPIIRKALLVGCVFGFTISMGEFGATAFLVRPETPTMPVAIYRYLAQPGAENYGQAMAMSSLLMLVSASGFLFLEKFRKNRIGEF